MRRKKTTILMLLMGLEIGGVETHVVELSKELTKRGFNIIVASNGGVYEKELVKFGIKHYDVPMHQRNILKMIRSYKLLKKIIIKEHIDIVHSHARIPGFICGFLYKKLDFVFVASTHGIYNTKMGLKYLTNWGKKVIAVSEDIKDYLIEEYNVRQKDIFLTINGIDTNKFSPSVSGDRIKKELKITNEPTIIHVSRLDEGGSATAAQVLISAAENINKSIPNVKIVIAGGGNLFNNLNKKAQQVNKKMGRKCILMIGSRTDVNEVIAAGDIFVGVSRAALEAMATGKVVILAGYAGYMGIFSENKLYDAINNNFCCRGFEETKAELLTDDILKAFKMSRKEKQELGEYGRKVIFEYYSIKRMADDCLKAYSAAIKQKKQKQYNVVMSGYYGFNNSGDEAILVSMHKNIQEIGDNINITVLSNNPKETRAKYGVDVLYRFGICDVFKAIKGCDVLLSGGGSLLQDSTSTRSLMYYLSIILLAKLLRKKVMLYANGIGPVSKKLNRNIVKIVVNKADLITLREENSFDELKLMGVSAKSHVTADPVFTLDGISKNDAQKLLIKAGVPLDKKIVGISVRNWRNMGAFTDKLAKLCDNIYEKYNMNIVFIVMQVPNDFNISQKIQRKMKNVSYILKDNYSPYETIGLMQCMSFILSMRLHTLIFAARQHVPLIGFIYDPKIEYYLEKLEMPSAGRVEEFNVEKTMKQVEDIINNSEKYIKHLEKCATQLREAAHKNEEYLMKLLEIDNKEVKYL